MTTMTERAIAIEALELLDEVLPAAEESIADAVRMIELVLEYRKVLLAVRDAASGTMTGNYWLPSDVLDQVDEVLTLAP